MHRKRRDDENNKRNGGVVSLTCQTSSRNSYRRGRGKGDGVNGRLRFKRSLPWRIRLKAERERLQAVETAIEEREETAMEKLEK